MTLVSYKNSKDYQCWVIDGFRRVTHEMFAFLFNVANKFQTIYSGISVF